MFTVVGKTVDGRLVVRGVYRFYETHGLPLDVLFEAFRDRGIIPDWWGFIVEAVEAGVDPERALSKLDPAIADSFGTAMRDVVISRLSRMLRTGNTPPNVTATLFLLADEYATIQQKLSNLRAPSFDEVLIILSSVVGQEAVQQIIQGEIVGMKVVEKLPANRLAKLDALV